MKKSLIIAATAVVLLGGSAAGYHAYARYDGWGHGRHHSRMTAADMSAYADARIAALRAGLTLTPDQQKLWPPVEAALKEIATKHVERREAFRTERRDLTERSERNVRPDPIERLRKGADRMSKTGADLKRLADATEPLYQSLDDAQKRRFDRLARAGMRAELRQESRNQGSQWRRGDGGRFMDRERRGDGRDYRHHRRDRIDWTEQTPQGAERL